MTAGDIAKGAAQKASPWVETAGRIGYAAKGIIYGIIGILAFVAATSDGGKTTDKKGAINSIAEQPFGEVLLIVLGAGLFCYSLFKLVMATLNPEGDKPLKRIGNGVTGLIYGGVGFAAIKASMGEKSADNTEQQASGLMALPFGVWLLAAIGLIILGTGFLQVYKGWTGKFMESLRTGEMSEKERRTAEISGKIGNISRGVVFVITGGFLLWAAKDHDADKAGGIDQSLQAIASAPYGPILLAATGLGLVAYALFMFVEAKFRKYTPVVAPR